MTEDEMAGWHHRLNGHEFEQAPGDGEDQRSLQSWGHKESDMIEQLNNNNKVCHRFPSREQASQFYGCSHGLQ